MDLFGSFLGDDDFWDRCDIKFSYAGHAWINEIEVFYDTGVEAGTASCIVDIKRSGGTGLSCQGVKDFGCADVQAVNIVDVFCYGPDGETDCGAVNVHSVGTELIKDAR